MEPSFTHSPTPWLGFSLQRADAALLCLVFRCACPFYPGSWNFRQYPSSHMLITAYSSNQNTVESVRGIFWTGGEVSFPFHHYWSIFANGGVKFRGIWLQKGGTAVQAHLGQAYVTFMRACTEQLRQIVIDEPFVNSLFEVPFPFPPCSGSVGQGGVWCTLQNWYKAQMDLMNSWLTERMERSLSPYQLTSLLFIVKKAPILPPPISSPFEGSPGCRCTRTSSSRASTRRR